MLAHIDRNDKLKNETVTESWNIRDRIKIMKFTKDYLCLQ